MKHESRIVELKFGHSGLEVLEIRGIDWVDAAKDHGMDLLKARQRIKSWTSSIGQSVADLDISGTLNIGDEVSNIPGVKARLWDHLWRKNADLFDFVILFGRHQLDAKSRRDAPGGDPDVGNYAAIAVKDTVKNEAPECFVGRLRRRNAMDDGLENFLNAEADLGACFYGFIGGDRQNVFKLFLYRLDVRIRKVNFIDDRNNGQALFERQMDVGDRLRLNPLSGIHDQQGAFASREASGDFIGEIDVSRGIEQVKPVIVSIFRAIFHCYRMRFDRDTAFALQIHRIKQLVLFITLGDCPGALQQTVGQGCLAVVNVRDDAKIARACDGHRERWGNILDRNGPVNIAN